MPPGRPASRAFAVALGPLAIWIFVSMVITGLSTVRDDGVFLLATWAGLVLLGAGVRTLLLDAPGGGASALGLGETLGLGAGIGLVAGLGETWYLGGRVWFLGRVPPDNWTFGRESLWLAPLTSLALFAGGASLLWIGGRLIRRPLTFGVAVFFGTGLTLGAWIAQTGRVHPAAAAIFALGAAYRLATLVRDRRLDAGRTRAAMALGLSTVAVAAGLIAALPVLRERAAVSALAAPPSGPNVLIIVLDTHRAASMSVHGGTPGTTPGLERWSGRGLAFDHALSSSSWTLPSHATMFTGIHNVELGTDPHTPLGEGPLTLAEFFSARGYRTGGFVANLFYTSEFFGLSRGFHRYRDHPASLGMALNSSFWPRTVIREVRARTGVPREFVKKPAPDVTGQFLGWLSEQDERPFFAFLNYFDAHAPYEPPSDFVDETRGRPVPWYHRGVRAGAYSADELAALRDTYEAAIRYVDDAIDTLLKDLEASGTLANTLVVVTSDHGETFGEHGRVGHGHSLYPEETRVPLLMLLPENLASRVGTVGRVAEPVSLRDLPATLLSTLGHSPAFPGKPFLDVPLPDTLLTEIETGWLGLTAGGFRYLVRPDGTEELYDLQADPEHLDDLASQPGQSGRLADFRSALEARRGSSPN